MGVWVHVCLCLRVSLRLAVSVCVGVCVYVSVGFCLSVYLHCLVFACFCWSECGRNDSSTGSILRAASALYGLSRSYLMPFAVHDPVSSWSLAGSLFNVTAFGRDCCVFRYFSQSCSPPTQSLRANVLHSRLHCVSLYSHLAYSTELMRFPYLARSLLAATFHTANMWETTTAAASAAT